MTLTKSELSALRSIRETEYIVIIGDGAMPNFNGIPRIVIKSIIAKTLVEPRVRVKRNDSKEYVLSDLGNRLLDEHLAAVEPEGFAW